MERGRINNNKNKLIRLKSEFEEQRQMEKNKDVNQMVLRRHTA